MDEHAIPALPDVEGNKVATGSALAKLCKAFTIVQCVRTIDCQASPPRPSCLAQYLPPSMSSCSPARHLFTLYMLSDQAHTEEQQRQQAEGLCAEPYLSKIVIC